ncbi:MAG TPA: hypothetical protein DEH02_03530 [Bacteroidales bacterium]|nr:MAG: hypothetical protein A2X01_14830 [Bacteroidetes bacterium GWF2_35_48]OFY97179.1 MAG: hypothetical protein A2491_21435 [Bacteroidetes bacterium RIFOXYC12_FULL_35_7]HBX50122.1 hypothetical protein [Bacteroidales bacterium]
MKDFKLYGKLLANASLLPESESLIFQRLQENKDYLFMKAKNFLAIGSEDKHKTEALNILKRPVKILQSGTTKFYVIIHEIINVKV